MTLNNRRNVIWYLLSAVLVLTALPAYGQLGRDITESNLTEQERRDTTLLWLDTFMTESDLLSDEDMAKIRTAVAQMPSTQLKQWLAQTKQLRQYVEGEKWQQTKLWLREFLRVQSIYSEEELQGLRNEIVQADASQMLAILSFNIQAKHDSLVWMHQAHERNRQVEVEERDVYLAQQAVAAQAARNSRATDAPIYGSGVGGTGEKPSKGYVTPYPLMNSRSMARAAVWSEVWGPGFIIGF